MDKGPAMWSYYPELLARPVPRYTSYPTAAEFSGAVGEADMAAGLADIAPGTEYSLYVHIPYCQHICWYCACNTGAANKSARLNAYMDALHQEIALVARALGGRGKAARIAFGGGSPNALAPVDFVRMLDALLMAFNADKPVMSVEIDPRTFDAGWGEMLKGAGIARASFGVQTFDPAVQAAIGRVQPYERIVDGMRMLRDAGMDSVNFDLMYGLPEQSLDILEDSLEKTVALGADRIALFGYAHVPHLVPRQRQIKPEYLPGQSERFDMAAFGYDYLVKAGYVPVGFDHFARPGDALAQAALDGTLRRNFQGFTDDPAEVLIGLGSTAISGFPDRLIQNDKNPGSYRTRIDKGRLPAALGVLRTPDDREHAIVIEDILCRNAANLDPVGGVQRYAHDLAPFLNRNLISFDGATMRLSAGALPYARSIAAVFDPYRAQQPNRFSNAV